MLESEGCVRVIVVCEGSEQQSLKTQENRIRAPSNIEEDKLTFEPFEKAGLPEDRLLQISTSPPPSFARQPLLVTWLSSSAYRLLLIDQCKDGKSHQLMRGSGPLTGHTILYEAIVKVVRICFSRAQCRKKEEPLDCPRG